VREKERILVNRCLKKKLAEELSGSMEIKEEVGI